MMFALGVLLYVAFGIHFMRYAWWSSKNDGELPGTLMVVNGLVWPLIIVRAAILQIRDNLRG